MLLTTDEVAAILRIHPDVVRRWARKGKLRTVKLGSRCWRFKQEELDKFIERRSS
jgi:excisionase family DNA binding protein